jgi:hypothetical protein
MTVGDLTARSPLRALDRPAGAPGARTSLVAARAGTGKTALLVQLALDAMLRGVPVLHVSIGETLPHVKRWYQGVYRDLTAGLAPEAAREAWEQAERLRLLMAFRAGAFSVERLVARLRLLDAEGVFAPRVVVADGFRLEPALDDDARALGRFAAERNLELWLAGRTPRETDELGPAVAAVAGLFETIVLLEPEADAVTLRVVQGPPGERPALRLDPGTMLVKRA